MGIFFLNDFCPFLCLGYSPKPYSNLSDHCIRACGARVGRYQSPSTSMGRSVEIAGSMDSAWMEEDRDTSGCK